MITIRELKRRLEAAGYTVYRPVYQGGRCQLCGDRINRAITVYRPKIRTGGVLSGLFIPEFAAHLDCLRWPEGEEAKTRAAGVLASVGVDL